MATLILSPNPTMLRAQAVAASAWNQFEAASCRKDCATPADVLTRSLNGVIDRMAWYREQPLCRDGIWLYSQADIDAAVRKIAQAGYLVSLKTLATVESNGRRFVLRDRGVGSYRRDGHLP